MVAEENFTYMNEDDIDSDLKCDICKRPLVHPVTVSSSCQQTFCQHCARTNYAVHSDSCRDCQDKTFSPDDFKPEGQRFNRMLDNLLVKCPHCSQDNIKRGEHPRHYNEVCPKRTVSCAATDVQCPWIGPYDESDQHSDTCPYLKLRPELTELLGNKRDLDRLQHDHQQLIDQCKEQQTIVEQLKNDNQRLNEQVKQMGVFQQQNHDQLAQNTILTGEKTALTQQKAELEQKIKLVDEQLQKAQTDLDQLNTDNQYLNEQINKFKDLETAYEQLKVENQRSKEQCDEHQKELTHRQQSLDEQTNQLNDHNQTLSERMDQLQALEIDCERLKSENQSLKEQHDQHQMTQSTLRASMEEQAKRLNELVFLPQQVHTLAEQNHLLTQKLQEFNSLKNEHQKLLQFYQEQANENVQIKAQLAPFDRLQADNQRLNQQVIKWERVSELSTSQIKRLQVKLTKPECPQKYFRDDKDGYKNQKLEEFIKKGQQGTLINFNGEKLNDNDMNIMIHASLTNPRFQQIVLWNNHLTEPSLNKLFSSFSYNRILQVLSISKNHLSDESMKCLSEALSYNNYTLKRLTLSSNQITDRGVCYLATMLKSNDSLTALGLRENEISDQSMEFFWEVIQLYNRTIKEVCLDGNEKITDASVDFIANAVMDSLSLKTLWICGCQFSKQAKEKLHQSSKNKKEFELKI